MGYPAGYPGSCPDCGTVRRHSGTYDAAFCPLCDEWQSPLCRRDCGACESRPPRPSQAWELALVDPEPLAEYDLDLKDDFELLRRVVEPVVNGLFSPQEITSVEIVRERNRQVPRVAWPNPASPRQHWPLDLPLPREVRCRVTAANGEVEDVWLGYEGVTNAHHVADKLAEDLEDAYSESSWGWGQQRHARYLVLPAQS
jgi:hypothetical protein